MSEQKTEQRDIATILRESETIAVFGISDQPYRDSHRIAGMLIDSGYKVYGVNPTIDEALGMKTYENLQSLPEPVDIVDVFRNSRYAKEVVQQAIEAKARTVWFQLGAEDDEAAEMARNAGLEVIMGHCIGVEVRVRGISKK